MTRKPAFWIVLTVLGLAGSVVAYRLFPVAFPILAVDIEMDREEALDQARQLAGRYRWDPEGYRQAASFGQRDQAFQTYMELEGGGLEALNDLVREGAVSLYAWRVRHFAPGVVEETEVRFDPGGEPLGFRLRLPEDAPGDSLSPERARSLAQERATQDWGFDLSRYQLLESSQEERPGGRLDHTFVYQRNDLALGESRVRLRLGIAGDRLVEVSPFFYVPDGFLRRYQETRNANESISLVGTVLFLLLFLTVAGGMGAVHLLRHRLVEWKPALFWGGLVAGLMALGSVNSLPLSWMSYDTALPVDVYVATIITTAAVIFVGGAALLALVFIIGEGLLRVGFQEEIQLWRIWSPGVANSTPAIGRSLAPYLVLGIQLAYVVVFYLVMSRTLGWWSPASALAEPDLLATYFPWLTAVSTSLFAALSEETVFRAIPIGAAAFIGRRRGRPALWIWGAVILQALVFGASHANYPQQPPYARVVEIFPVYLAWGAVTVFFGLIPAIIGHFTYNLVLLSLPLFAAETSGIWIDRGMVILAGLFPLGVVVWMRLRHGPVAEAPNWALNRAGRAPSRKETEAGGSSPADRVPDEGSWAAETFEDGPKADRAPQKGPSPAEGPDQEPPELRPPGERTPGERTPGERTPGKVGPDRSRPLPSWATPLAFVGGVLGLVLWVSGLSTDPPPRVTANRAEVRAAARTFLSEEARELGPDWLPLVSVRAGQGLAHAFVWEEGTEESYEDLVGRFLSSPEWEVRFVNFQLPPEERAETFTVTVSPDGRPKGLRHVLPEGRSGGELSEAQARVLALEALQERWSVGPDEIREISAEETAQPNRTDWTFSFAATEGYPLAVGEGRFEARISGAEVVDARRYVHIPQEWERARRADQSRRTLASIPIAAVGVLLGLAALILAVVKWARGSLETRVVRALTPTMALLLLATALNEWPNVQSAFTTELSRGNQTGIFVLGMILGVAFLAVSAGLLGALADTWLKSSETPARGSNLWVGLGLGFLGFGALSGLSRLGPSGPPAWPDYGGAATYVPWLAQALSDVVGFILLVVGFFAIVAALERLRGGRWAWSAIVVLLSLGLLVVPNNPGSSWFLWLGGAVAFSLGVALLWAFARNLGWILLPGALLAPFILRAVSMSLDRPYPGAVLGAWLGVAIVGMASRAWTRVSG